MLITSVSLSRRVLATSARMMSRSRRSAASSSVLSCRRVNSLSIFFSSSSLDWTAQGNANKSPFSSSTISSASTIRFFQTTTTHYKTTAGNDNAAKQPDAIQAQLDRATKQLEELSTDKSHPAIPEIQAALKDGHVKPFFPTLFLPETFLNNRRSFSGVIAGKVNEKRELKFDTFCKNLGKVIDNTGKGAGAIIDRGMGEPWEFSHELTDFAVELVNTDAKMLGNDVESTKLTSIPFMINSGDESLELFTRPESRGVVSNIFHRFADKLAVGSVAAITGSPGIGKSWALLFALQQALLYDGANVLFVYQKTTDAVMYLRRNNKVYAWTSRPKDKAGSNLFKRLDVLVLLDPPEAEKGGANFNLGKMKLLFAASNNEKHFDGALEKNYGDFQTFLGPPLDSELNVILAHLDPSLEPAVIEDRKKDVGNLIRYILDVEKYEKRTDATKKAVDECARNKTLLNKALQDEGMSSGHQTIPGTLFQVLPTRPDDLTTIGYDGQGVEYRKRVVLAANGNVRNAILTAGRETILSYWGRVSGDEYSGMGRVTERLFIDDLTNDDGMVMTRYLQMSKKERNRVEK